MAESFTISQATIFDLEDLAGLFNQYRVFYAQAPDLAVAREFLRARLEHGQSTCFLARGELAEAFGYAQLYPMFSSGAAARIYILNDLFVVQGARERGIGRALLAEAVRFAKASGAAALRLSTKVDNAPAQALYEREGWQRETEFVSYNFKL